MIIRVKPEAIYIICIDIYFVDITPEWKKSGEALFIIIIFYYY